MAALVLAKSQVAGHQTRSEGRHLGCPSAFFAQQTVDGFGGDSREEHAFVVCPRSFHAGRAAANEDRAWGAKRDQLMRVHRQVA